MSDITETPEVTDESAPGGGEKPSVTRRVTTWVKEHKEVIIGTAAFVGLTAVGLFLAKGAGDDEDAGGTWYSEDSEDPRDPEDREDPKPEPDSGSQSRQSPREHTVSSHERKRDDGTVIKIPEYKRGKGDAA